MFGVSKAASTCGQFPIKLFYRFDCFTKSHFSVTNTILLSFTSLNLQNMKFVVLNINLDLIC